MIGLAEREIARVDWGRLREATGSAEGIGRALGRLLAASPDEVSSIYWELENHIVVQGELFESAEASVSVLVAAFADERPSHVRIAILELLYQVLSGEPGEAERSRGGSDLANRCRARAREGFWLLMREYVVGERDAALTVLELLDIENRLSTFG